ncbi:hypothetical protein BIWAKO_04801 [Bosea sp. BIWAKO-01]|nr:hypothetical protein BIWAKO_04801 [Bosea sp. BIWAKO-01]
MPAFKQAEDVFQRCFVARNDSDKATAFRTQNARQPARVPEIAKFSEAQAEADFASSSRSA